MPGLAPPKAQTGGRAREKKERKKKKKKVPRTGFEPWFGAVS